MLRSCLVVLFTLLLSASSSTHTAPVTIDARPRIGLAPATVNIVVRVEPKDTNRGLLLVIDGENYYRSSFDPDFAGSDSPAIRTFQYEIRTPGHYTIYTVLKRTAPDNDQTASIEFCLAGMDVECGSQQR